MQFFRKIGLLFSKLSDLMISFIKSNSGRLVDEILDIAYDVVKRVERRSTGSSNKFSLALEALTAELGERAAKYSAKILHTAIQEAVVLLEENGEEVKSKKK
jgi:uncharacterized protein (DUF1015 family)